MRHLIVDWEKLLPALILLLTPVAALQGKRVQFRDLSRDWEHFWSPTITLWQHGFDLLRAALGAWLLFHSFSLAPGASRMAAMAILFAQGGIQVLATLLQTVICREPDSSNAPFSFVTGLLLAGVSPVVAVLALAFAIPIATGTRTPAAFFPVLAVVYFGLAPAFGGKSLLVRGCGGACAAILPWLWSILFHRAFVVSHRPKDLTGSTSSKLDQLRG